MSDFTSDQLRVLKALADGILGGMRGSASAAPNGSAPAGGASGEVADASDLDSQWGDPEIKKDPKRWAGESMVGRRYSETTAEYLDVVAEFLSWKSSKPLPGKEKYAAYDAKDAARARGWAARLRNGHQAPAPAPRAPAPVDPADLPYEAPLDDSEIPS